MYCVKFLVINALCKTSNKYYLRSILILFASWCLNSQILYDHTQRIIITCPAYELINIKNNNKHQIYNPLNINIRLTYVRISFEKLINILCIDKN